MYVCCAGVLEVLNSLLFSGEVPGLFTPEELSKELASLDSKRDKDPHYQVQHRLIANHTCPAFSATTRTSRRACRLARCLSNLQAVSTLMAV